MHIRSIAFAAVLAAGFAAAVSAADVTKGKAVFDSATPKCTSCHTATKNPLDKVGARKTEAEIKAWVRTPKEQMAKENKKGMMPAYGPSKISDADLDALAAYVASMK